MRAAELLLAALGRTEFETDDDYARALAGAVLLSEAMHDLRIVRMALTDGKT